MRVACYGDTTHTTSVNMMPHSLQENNKDATAVFDGHMILWKSPNKYDVLYKLTYPTVTRIDQVSASYDAGATFALLDSNKKEILSKKCYASNGGRTNACVLDLGGGSHSISGQVFYLKIDSKHGTWNWFGNIKITDYCAKGKTCGRNINILQDGQQHGEGVKHGGHTEANKDGRLAFSNHMIMWKSPNKYDVLYRIKFVIVLLLSSGSPGFWFSAKE